MPQAKMAREPENIRDKTSATSPKPQSPPSHDEIARLAHSYWLERGDKPDSPEEDWLRAERDLQAGIGHARLVDIKAWTPESVENRYGLEHR